MKLSVSDAARRAGVDRKVIYRKLASGEISREVGQDGKTTIDLSELARIYPNVVTPELVTSPNLSQEGDRLLQAEITHLRAQLEAERERRHAAETDRDAWRDQAKQLALLAPPAKGHKGLISRLLGLGRG